MSVNVVQSVIVDPTFHSNKRTEFKLYNKGRVFQPDLRLVDFGVSAATNNQGPTAFSLSGGILSIIKHISLYFDDILVDQVKDASQYLSIQNLAQPSYTVFRDSNNKLVRSNLILNREEVDDATLELDEPSTALIGRLRLADVFPLLTIMNSVDAKGNLMSPLVDINEIRVSIEYETTISKIFSAPLPTGFTVSQPAIIYTEIFGSSATMAPNLRFDAVEGERFILSATNNKQSVRLRAFDQKILTSLLFQNLPNNQTDDNLCLQYSSSLPNEKVNLMVNGQSFLAFQGADNECKKLLWTTDSFALGYHFSPLGCAMTNVTDEQFTQYGNELLSLQSKLSYLGISVGRAIDRLFYEVSFDGQGGTPVTVHAYGKVSKIFSRIGDTFMTQYAQLSKSK